MQKQMRRRWLAKIRSDDPTGAPPLGAPQSLRLGKDPAEDGLIVMPRQVGPLTTVHLPFFHATRALRNDFVLGHSVVGFA
jgi:hypothetical protein